MKSHHLFLIIFLTVGAYILYSCGSTKAQALNSVKLTSQLRPGMSYAEIESILGKPKSSHMIDDKWIARYTLQEMCTQNGDAAIVVGERKFVTAYNRPRW